MDVEADRAIARGLRNQADLYYDYLTQSEIPLSEQERKRIHEHRWRCIIEAARIERELPRTVIH